MAEDKPMVIFHLPFDIIIEILSRLPVKAVLRFKTVCKAWYALIKSPRFIAKHVKDCPGISSVLVTAPGSMYFNDEGIYKPFHYESLISSDGASFRLVGICAGLVCVDFSFDSIKYDYIVGNLATRDFRRIPSPKLLNMERDLLFSGFSCFPNDYKLVRVIYHVLIGEVVVKAEVYTMSSGTWVEIDVIMGRVNYAEHLIWHRFHSKMPVFQNGVFYWMAGSLSEARVMSFDISQGYYDEINIPSHIIGIEKRSWTIVNFKDDISLIINYTNHYWLFDVWALNSCRNSWKLKVRIHHLPVSLESFTVMGYKTNGEILVESRRGNNFMVFLYDLDRGKTKFFTNLSNFNGMANDYHFYTESLRPVRALNEE